MTIEPTYHPFLNTKKRKLFVLACLLVLCGFTIASDFLYARWQSSSFYFSESLLFSSFWLLFFPLLNVQLQLALKVKTIWVNTIAIVLATGIHLLAYPALVWLMSALFYENTFPYWRTFNFGLTEHVIKALIIYSLPFPIIAIYKNRKETKPVAEDKPLPPAPSFLSSMIVTEANNKKTSIVTSDIMFFSANAPYINIFHRDKKYIHSGTLKSLETQLDHNLFIRIHKSYLINIAFVSSYQSRHNGDYDVTLSDNTILRISRKYAAVFKNKLEVYQRVNIK